MAIAAWDSRNPQLQMHAGGSIPQIVYGNNEANSQSFKAGNLITLHASTGLVTAIADSSGSASPIAGIAMEDATTVSSGNIEIPFMAITSETEVLIRVADNSEALEASDTWI